MNKNTYKILLSASLATVAFGLTGCPTDPVPTDTGRTDAPVVPTDTPALDDAPVAITNDCAGYCALVTASCEDEDSQYDAAADCLSYCAASGWPAGAPGVTSGNTIACRIYHAGVAAGDPGTHCGHAGPSGGAVCGAAITFTTMAGTRVDRMGMPVVSTALIGAARKNAYNDASPADDAGSPGFVADLGPTLAGLHAALDDDLTGMGLTPCSMTTLIDTGTPLGMLPECFGQPVAPGVPVAALVIPDTLNIDPALPAVFPNGRRLADSVVTPTLALILLRLGGTCGASTCGLGTLSGLSPQTNDASRPFLTTFPYLAAPHTVAP